MTQHVLACFGGAGGQHACAIAAALGVPSIFFQRYGGILSAVGIGLAEVVEEVQVRPGCMFDAVPSMDWLPGAGAMPSRMGIPPCIIN